MFKIIYLINKFIRRVILHIDNHCLRKSLGGVSEHAALIDPKIITSPHKIYLEEHAKVYAGATFIMNPETVEGRFIMKKYSAAAQGLTVITNNHSSHPTIGHFYQEDSLSHELDKDLDVIVEEDVWIGANVTILPGVTIGRGSIVGTGALLRNSVPPYSVTIGNPARIVGFKFTPEEIIEHEKSLYQENERIPIEKLEKNYKKYFLDRMKEIRSFTSL